MYTCMIAEICGVYSQTEAHCLACATFHLSIHLKLSISELVEMLNPLQLQSKYEPNNNDMISIVSILFIAALIIYGFTEWYFYTGELFKSMTMTITHASPFYQLK